ncbi:MBL fold metallo-hydrolase [Cytobacillus purgationiresistens]|uniref:Beta-lactamase superfamily II metal-dependent hydrolase n=1 Tax=Cytobacillus purgationiresistens TaxID=863449 RepID=A0ABU0AAM3_9BACI|nr:MBL fold metallo-hydrolase [Cytobacillus purgationiresistens]MDQ0268301.1 beta-lactamase superfamily II metal-dependent hydrolase [Cytobacillus purgationiresistens]
MKKLIILLLLILSGCGVSTAVDSSDRPKPENELFAHFINVGQADATLIQFSEADEDYAILIDAGDFTGTEVIDYLHQQSINHIDLAIGTHPDADHIGQLDRVIEELNVDEVWLSGNLSTSKVFQRVLAAIDSQQTEYYEPRAGEEFDIGPLNIEVLYPNEITGDTNEESVSLKLTYGDIRFIFTGDAAKKNERAMIEAGFNLEADILHLGHHGSSTSTSEEFLNAVNPDIAIYSAGMGNSYGHPHKEVVELIQRNKIHLYGTDIDGTIKIITDGEDFEVVTNNPSNQDSPVEKIEPEIVKFVDSSCINVNTASAMELQEIIHIGDERAQQIIELRPLKSLDELSKISGIGPARMADIIDENLACVGG